MLSLKEINHKVRLIISLRTYTSLNLGLVSTLFTFIPDSSIWFHIFLSAYSESAFYFESAVRRKRCV